MLKSFGAVLAALPLLSQPSVQYQLRFPNAVHHEAEIRAVFSEIRGPDLDVLMSRSSPGRYAIHEFAKNVYLLRAIDGQGTPLSVERVSPSEWKVKGHHGTVAIEYTLFGDLTDGTYAAIDETHAHLNLPATLVWARGFENAPATLKFEIPQGSNWRAATQLKPQSDGTWWAPNLEWMMDSPVELSVHTMPEWTVGEARFRLALHHRGTDEQASAYAQMCKAVVTEEEGIFGAFPKYDTGSYTFLIDYLPNAAGDGMEHRDSTVITGRSNLKESANSAIEVVAHEFFHSWNVKRVRPRLLEPFDFEHANMSDELWFAEGFTNYYGPLALKRAGLSSLEDFAEEMGSAVNQVLNSPGRQIFDVIDMSRMAPFVDAAKSIDPTNRPNTFISYYTYGEALALGIDLAMRQKFPGKSLDDWMRTMWKEHPDIDKPYTLADLEGTLGEVTGDGAWAHEIFEKQIYGKDPLDYARLLESAGLVLRKSKAGQCWIGQQSLKYTAGGIELESGTLRGSPLYNAGLDRGDRILEMEGKAVNTESEMEKFLRRHKPGDRVRLRVSTRIGEKQLAMELQENPTLEIITFEQAKRPLTRPVEEFRKAWLTSKAVHQLPRIDPMP